MDIETAPASAPATDIHGPRVDGNIIAIFKSKLEARRVARAWLISGIAVPVHTRFQSLYAIKADNGQFVTRAAIAACKAKWKEITQ
jgi:hypothetical protein